MAPTVWLLTLLLLLAACLAAFVGALSQTNVTEGLGPQSSGGTKTGLPVLVLVMLAFPDAKTSPAITDGPNILPAVQLAADHINQRGDMLVNHSISLVVQDDGCNVVSTAAVNYLDFLTRYGDGLSFLAGMVGPSCSDSAVFVGALNAHAEMALVNLHIAASPVLQEESKFPYSLSMVGTSDDYVEVLRIVVRNRWESAVVIFENDGAFYRQIAIQMAKLKGLGKYSNPEQHAIPVSSDSIHQSLVTLNTYTSPKPCVIVLLASDYLSRMLLCYASAKGYNSYKWLLVETTLKDLSTPVNFTYAGAEYACSHGDMLSILWEALFLFVKLVPQSQSERTISGYTYTEYWAQYTERVRNAGKSLQTNPWANVLYDAMWALALSLNGSIDDLALYSEQRKNMALSIRIHDKLKAVVDFEGVSGRIKFTNNTIRRIINISQALDNTEILIGEYFPENKTFRMHREGGFLSCFSDKLLFVRILLYFAASVTLVMTIASHVLTLLYWNRQHIRASDPRLSQYTFAGCYLCCFGMVVYTSAKMYPLGLEEYRACCYAINFSVFLGFCLMTSSLLARTWRFYRIFTYYGNPGPFVSSCALNTFITASTSLMATLLVIWAVAWPYRGEFQPDGTLACVGKGNSYAIWDIVLIGYCWLQLFFASILSVATSKISRPQKKLFRVDSPAAFGYVASIILVLSGVFLAVFKSATAYYIIISLLCCGLVIFSLVFVMLPPAMSVCKERSSRLQP